MAGMRASPSRQRLLQPLDVPRLQDTRPPGPEREHERLPGDAEPLLAEVEPREAGRRVEGRVADEERGVGGLEHRAQVRRTVHVLRIASQPLAEQDAAQRHAGAAGGVEGDAPDRAPGAPRWKSSTDRTGPRLPMATPGTIA